MKGKMNERTIEKVMDLQASPERMWSWVHEPAELGELVDFICTP